MKRFVGSWKYDASKDSVYTWIIKPLRKGYELHMKVMNKEKTFYEIKDLWGFDSKSETWITFTLRSGGGYAIYYGKFISNNEFYWNKFDISNPEIILGRDYVRTEKIVKL